MINDGMEIFNPYDANAIPGIYDIIHYERKDNSLICYTKDETYEIEYSKEREKELLTILRNNAKKLIAKLNSEYNQEEYKKIISHLRRGKMWTIIFFVNMIAKEDKVSDGISIGFICAWTIINIVHAILLEKHLETKRTSKKLEYFLENEKIINKEIIERYLEEHQDQVNETTLEDAPVVTINDVYNMTIQELKEIVENIESREENELNLLLN